MSPTSLLRPSTFSRLLRATLGALALGALALPAAANIPLSERQVLLDLFNGTDGQNWTNKTGWGAPVAGDECSWRGITCTGDNVTGISLWKNNLKGSLPTNLKDLTKLERFGVSENELSGPLPELPASLFYVAVNANKLTGSIPTLPAGLDYLNVDDNDLSGAIPALPSQIGGGGTLSFRNNRLSGPIPALPAASYIVAFDNNQLTGPIPALPAGLFIFTATNNQLSGPMPAALSAGIAVFAVGNNRLTGTAPAATATLESNVDVSSLCPNLLDTPYRADPAWDRATGSTPWYAACRAAPPVGVPTLGEWALLMLGLTAAGLGARRLRRRTH